jgi:radical SAM enzyme (TIGR01210 family)
MLLMFAHDEEKPLACWEGTDRYQGRILKSLTVILKTGGCSWNGCLMCSYRHERYSPRSREELLKNILHQLNYIAAHYSLPDVEMVKIFTSGSFFDPVEVPVEVWQRAGGLFHGKVIIAETRPEYVHRDVLTEFISLVDNGTYSTPLYVAMGLETSDDRIREKSVAKGFNFAQFLNAANAARGAGAGIKAYLLMKPLFLTEMEAIKDMKKSIRDLDGTADMISMNPCTVQRGTVMEWYWKQGAYRPPWLWSVADVLASSSREVLCDPLGGGQKRGAHNCGDCDREITNAIRAYSQSGDRNLIEAVVESGCRCREEWEFVLESELPWCMPLSR